MKKKIALLLCATMVAGCLAGCGNTAKEEVTEDSATVTESEATTEAGEEDADTEEASTNGAVDVSTFTLDGKVYSLPMTFDEMEQISPLSSKILIGTPVISTNGPIETFGDNETDFELENGLKVGFENTSGSEQEVCNCKNVLIRVTKDMDIDVDVNGITIGSTIDDVLKAFPIYSNDETMDYYSLTFGKVQLNEKGHYELLEEVENSLNEDYTAYNEDVLNNESLFDADYVGVDDRVTFIIENGKVIEITIESYDM